MTLPELLQWVSLGGKTGVLELENWPVEKRIYFDGGRIVSAASNDPREYFGQFLLRARLITEAELDAAFQLQKQNGVMLGKVLVELSRLSEAQVVEQLVLKAEETILETFHWQEGAFRFTDTAIEEHDLVPISLDLTGLIAEGSRRIRELEDLRETFTSLQTFEVDWECFRASGESRALAEDIVAMADDNRTVAEMCLELHTSELLVGRTLRQLLGEGSLRMKEALELDAEDLSVALVDELLLLGKELVTKGRHAEAVEVLRRAVEMGSTRVPESSIEEANSKWRKELPGDIQELAPSLVGSVEQDDMGAEERFVLNRCHGGFTIDSIAKLAPFASEEVLRIVKKHLDRGNIELTRPRPPEA